MSDERDKPVEGADVEQTDEAEDEDFEGHSFGHEPGNVGGHEPDNVGGHEPDNVGGHEPENVGGH